MDNVNSNIGRNGLTKLGLSYNKYPLQEGDNVSYLYNAIKYH